jgi:O-antigen/teichoic acid export membrane protein
LRDFSLKALVQKFGAGSLGRNAAWVFLGQGMSFFLQAAYFILLARLLGSQQYGIFVGAAALVSIVSQYSSLGSGMVLLRYVSQDRRKFPEFWGNAILTTLAVGLCILVALNFAGKALVGSASASVLVLVALGECTCAKLAECAGQAFQAFEGLRITAILTTLTSAVRLTTVCVMMFTLQHATARQWAWASVIVSLISALAAILTVTSRLGKPVFRPRLLLKNAAEGLNFSFASSTTSVYNDLDKAMLSRYGMTAANGVYSMAYKIVDISCVPIRSLHSAALPRFFKKGVNGAQASVVFARKILKATLPCAMGSALLLYLCSALIPYLVGKSFTESVAVLKWLCLLPIFRSLHLSAGDSLTGAGYQRYRTASQFTAAATNFGLNLYLIPHFSWHGAAWSSLFTDGLLAVANWTILTYTISRERARESTDVIAARLEAEESLTPQAEFGD